MKTFLCAISLLVAVSLPAAELSTAPTKCAGRWAGIASFSHNKRGDFYIRRALLTFDVDPQGNVTNGVIRDFAGAPQTAFTGWPTRCAVTFAPDSGMWTAADSSDGLIWTAGGTTSGSPF